MLSNDKQVWMCTGLAWYTINVDLCIFSVPEYGIGREGTADYEDYSEYPDYNALNEDMKVNGLGPIQQIINMGS